MKKIRITMRREDGDNLLGLFQIGLEYNDQDADILIGRNILLKNLQEEGSMIKIPQYRGFLEGLKALAKQYEERGIFEDANFIKDELMWFENEVLRDE